jgi:hypothetical protein
MSARYDELLRESSFEVGMGAGAAQGHLCPECAISVVPISGLMCGECRATLAAQEKSGGQRK